MTFARSNKNPTVRFLFLSNDRLMLYIYFVLNFELWERQLDTAPSDSNNAYCNLTIFIGFIKLFMKMWNPFLPYIFIYYLGYRTLESFKLYFIIPWKKVRCIKNRFRKHFSYQMILLKSTNWWYRFIIAGWSIFIAHSIEKASRCRQEI